MKNKNQNQPHVPVLQNEVLHYLAPKPGESYLDVTAGFGGHASLILGVTKAQETTVLVDRDQTAIDALKKRFTDPKINLRHQDYLSVSKELVSEKRQFDMILADLGMSSRQLELADRGFSFNKEGPLDMRMDERQSLTANNIVNHYPEKELEHIIRMIGEEPKARRIAKLIVAHRPLKTTTELANVIAKTASWQWQRNRIHPATRTFQAIRIAVNKELELLEASLPLWLDLLTVGGRLVVISFHSLEDRIVKRVLHDRAGNRYDATLRLLTPHPVTASSDEIAFNPRARSAKLRAAVKIKIKEG